jgi:hypothetical protein
MTPSQIVPNKSVRISMYDVSRKPHPDGFRVSLLILTHTFVGMTPTLAAIEGMDPRKSLMLQLDGSSSQFDVF